MSRKSFARAKQRREPGGFVAFPSCVLRSEAMRLLSPFALKLLMELVGQYRGNNNGDLCMAWSILASRGWRSKATLEKAKKELLASGLIIIARQGGRHRPSLFALTFFSVDECDGKLDVDATRRPPGHWRRHEAPIATMARTVPRHL